MIVEFKNTWHVPGFGRKRFLKGTIVRDVPEALREILPKSASILPDNTPTEAETAKQNELEAADAARAALTDQEILEKAGVAGYADEAAKVEKAVSAKEVTEVEEDAKVSEGWEFNGKSYKTKAAMKAAITRSKGKK